MGSHKLTLHCLCHRESQICISYYTELAAPWDALERSWLPALGYILWCGKADDRPRERIPAGKKETRHIFTST